MQHHSKTTFALLAAAYLPSAFGCLYFNATLHLGANTANSAQDGVDISNQKLSGQDISSNDQRLDLNLWDDVDNDNIVEPLKDIFCSGIDLKPYAANTWTVPCRPAEKNAELDVTYNPDITTGGVLVNIYKYQNPRQQSKNFNDPTKDLLYTFQATSADGKGEYFETQFACQNCKDTAGRTVKCGNSLPKGSQLVSNPGN